jgi:hypothetical protein
MEFEDLELLVEVASRTGDVNPAGNSAFPILHSFHNASCLIAFRTFNALGSIHHLRAVGGLGYFCHKLSPLTGLPPHIHLNLVLRIGSSGAKQKALLPLFYTL